MKTRRPLPSGELQARIDATDPLRDAWVSAHAGSGKTRILRNRVIRLLLDGTAPDRILCLTYTRAAAAEMQGRIFAELARWVTLEDAALDVAIGDLVSVAPESYHASPSERSRARTLFARAIEAPGGLKVQTIHAFAERILHLFPIEAGVPLDFSILPDDEAEAMRLAARREVVDLAVLEPASDLGRAFGEILDAVSLPTFEGALNEALRKLADLELGDHPLPKAQGREKAYRALLGLSDTTTLKGLEAELLGSFSAAELEGAANAVEAQPKPSKTQVSFAQTLQAAAGALRSDTPDIETVLAPFVTKTTGTVKGPGVFIGAVIKIEPGLRAFEERARAACAHFLAARGALQTVLRSLAMLTFAEAVHQRYSRAKAARSLMDFSDLIGALRRLLRSGQSAWVMLKLDGGIDHVLLDEAQDTTREMWEIIAALTDEFFAGEGARKRVRTLFAVGDEKQSIYSFQGADPVVFEEYRSYFAQKSLRGELVRTPVPLKYSFRSSDDVLGAVDDAFRPEENRAGLTAGTSEIEHIAAEIHFPGHVELWPPARAAEKGPEEHGIPEKGAPSGVGALAQEIADLIAGWLSAPERHLVDGRPIRPGDILILVRERNAFFEAARKALKAAGVPVAGADRLTLQDEIVVQDLLALAQALLVPDDDLALAEALRSPVFGISEAALEALARHRAGSLRAALRDSTLEAFKGFADWLEARAIEARHKAPFAFLSGLLSAPAPARPDRSLRAVFAAVLGSEIHDPLNALLGEALNHEQEHPQALLPFVLAQRARKTQLKRNAENAQDKVRVMTVHGAKGLEGRIVFLGDAHGTPHPSKAPKVIVLKDRHGTAFPVWSALKGAQEPEVARTKRAEMRETLMGEYRRLLYVGMTRAADRLYIVSHARALTKDEWKEKGRELPDPENPLEASWYQMLRRALVKAEPYGEGETLHEALPARFKRRIVSKELPAPACADDRRPDAARPLPAWLRQPLPPEKPRETVLPSGGAYSTPADGAAAPFARRRGIVLHKLFELLPRVEPDAREATGLRLLSLIAPELPSGERTGFLAPVLNVLNGEIGARHFGPDSRAEVSISGEVTLPCGAIRTVPGRIDRLRVDDTRVEILDLKTGKPHAAGDDAGILQQMALYRALLTQLYPGRAILCHILWLESAGMETLPDAALDAAFAALKPA